jgi:hypothetical protein
MFYSDHPPRLTSPAITLSLVFLILALAPVPVLAENPEDPGPLLPRIVLADLHAPYDTTYTYDELENLWEMVERLPSETDPVAAGERVTQWELVGPWQLEVGTEWGSVNWTGRVRDVEADPTNPYYSLASRWGTDRGGLWSVTGDTPQCISDSLQTLAVGSFATHPTNRDLIILGTGNNDYTGRGVFRTTDGGANWTFIDLDNPVNFFNPSRCWKVRFHPLDPNRVYVAADNGFFESTDGGQTFTGLYDPAFKVEVSDFAFDLQDPGIVYIGVWDRNNSPGSVSGVYRADLSVAVPEFVRLGGGLPQTGVGRVSLTSSLGPDGTIFYASLASYNSGYVGVYTSYDGAVWHDVSPTPEEDWNFTNAWHNHLLGAAPWNPAEVFMGYVALFYSNNGGLSWTKTDVPRADHHAIAWSEADGYRRVLIANDGGVFRAGEASLYTDWQLDRPHPINEIHYFDVDPDDPTRMGLGAQDTGISLSGQPYLDPYFTHELGGDGGMVAIEPSGGSGDGPVYVTNGPVVNSPQYWNGYRSDDWGGAWTVTDDNGLFPSSTEWFRTMRLASDGRLYTSTFDQAWASDDGGDSWVFLAQAAPSAIRDISPLDDGSGNVWITSTATSGPGRVVLADVGGQIDRTAGLPDGNIATIVPRSSFAPSAVVVFNDHYVNGERFWITFNWGQLWVPVDDFNGTQPNLPYSDLAILPGNSAYWYLATEFGMFRSTNSGHDWIRWDRGLPPAVWVKELRIVRSPSGGTWLYASTFGRSIWRRSLDDDISVGVTPPPALSRLAYTAVGPNPFGDRVELRFRAPTAAPVSLKIIDPRGRLVRTLVTGLVANGEPVVAWDGRDKQGRAAADGVYFAVLEQRGGETVTRRLVRIR